VFVDEFDLPRLTEEERGGAPDYAVLWPTRIWLIELKTEPGSHRRDQLPSYFRLGAHHHPGMPIDITYLTPEMKVADPEIVAPNRYAHVTWQQVAGLVEGVWADVSPTEGGEVRDRLLETINQLATPVATWRQALTGVDVVDDDLPQAMRLIEATADDGQQRALDAELTSLEALQQLRLDVRRSIAQTPDGDPRRRVLPWLWTPASGGVPLTSAGRITGYELRLSRYSKQVVI